jgi:hypothetical protein
MAAKSAGAVGLSALVTPPYGRTLWAQLKWLTLAPRDRVVPKAPRGGRHRLPRATPPQRSSGVCTTAVALSGPQTARRTAVLTLERNHPESPCRSPAMTRRSPRDGVGAGAGFTPPRRFRASFPDAAKHAFRVIPSPPQKIDQAPPGNTRRLGNPIGRRSKLPDFGRCARRRSNNGTNILAGILTPPVTRHYPQQCPVSRKNDGRVHVRLNKASWSALRASTPPHGAPAIWRPPRVAGASAGTGRSAGSAPALAHFLRLEPTAHCRASSA